MSTEKMVTNETTEKNTDDNITIVGHDQNHDKVTTTVLDNVKESTGSL